MKRFHVKVDQTLGLDVKLILVTVIVARSLAA